MMDGVWMRIGVYTNILNQIIYILILDVGFANVLFWYLLKRFWYGQRFRSYYKYLTVWIFCSISTSAVS